MIQASRRLRFPRPTTRRRHGISPPRPSRHGRHGFARTRIITNKMSRRSTPPIFHMCKPSGRYSDNLTHFRGICLQLCKEFGKSRLQGSPRPNEGLTWPKRGARKGLPSSSPRPFHMAREAFLHFLSKYLTLPPQGGWGANTPMAAPRLPTADLHPVAEPPRNGLEKGESPSRWRTTDGDPI